MKIDDRFEVERDTYCWMLHDWRDGKDRDGNPKRMKRTTYHRDLVQVSEVILDRTAGECRALSELPTLLKAQTDRIVQAIEKARRDVANLHTDPAIVRAA